MSEPVVFRHRRFGELHASEASILEFPGLPGFPNARRFVVRQHDLGDDFAWLISLDDADLAFVIADPCAYVIDYAPRFESRGLTGLEYCEGDELQVVAMVTFPDGGMALNLAAPVLINLRSQKAVQSILEDGDWSTRHRIEEKPDSA